MISTNNKITLSDGTEKLVKDLKPNDRILTYDFYNQKVCQDFINVIEDDTRDEPIFYVKFVNNQGRIYELNIKGDVLFNVNTTKWKFDEKVPKNFCSLNYMRSAETLTDMFGFQLKILSIEECPFDNKDEKFVKIIPKFNKCVFVNNVSISCFPPKKY